jgi:hypothetical protein
MKKKQIVVFLLITILVACNVKPDGTVKPVDPFENLTPVVCPEILPMPEPMPEFLAGVSPIESITQAEYDETIEIGVPDLPYAGGIQATVYATGIDHAVMQSIDSHRGRALLERITLLVNGLMISEERTLISDFLMPEGPFQLEWVIDLNPGYHEATLIFDIDTGETVKYSWTFCIIP